VKTNTSVNTGQSVKVTYGSGSFSGMLMTYSDTMSLKYLRFSTGTEYTDTVTLGSGLIITNQSIGVASTSKGFSGHDGILGIGPKDLTNGTLKNSTTTTIPTVTENFYSQGTIPQEVIGASFEPTASKTDTNGELTFGGTDATKYIGAITYTYVGAARRFIRTHSNCLLQSSHQNPPCILLLGYQREHHLWHHNHFV
jgi:cathepsin E